MSNQFYNFNYSPIAQGFDSSTWRKLYGDVSVVNGKLQFTRAAIIHYGDILRGDITFNINIAKPFVDGNTKFGLIQYSKNVYAYFSIDGPVLTACISDGIVSSSEVITWQDSWTDTDTDFRIKWEAGSVRFYINGQFYVILSHESSLDIISSEVPNDPMSLYISSDSTDLFLLNYITAKSIQSFLMSEGNDNSVFEPFVNESDRITITESVTIAHAADMSVNDNDSINITENKTVTIDYSNPNLNSPLTITESVTVGTPA